MIEKLKTLAMYLPQFHRIPENDEWWGEGFSDWVAVRSADSLFEGHNQPRIPLGKNYYDLSDANVIRRQAEMAKEYGIDGFCIYHYYMKNGKKLLEKPAEALLKNKDIDIEYCFCWANETWARSWSKLYHTNPWSEKYETNIESGPEVLIQQAYGNKADWRRHFEYLLPFFKDDRYIKRDNKPVFVIYLPDDMPMYKEMFRCFNEWCIEAGFAGIFSIGANVNQPIDGMNAALYVHIRNDVLGIPDDIEMKNGVRTRQYDKVWEQVLSLPRVKGIPTYFGGFVDRDETPRKGARGLCILGGSPSAFEKNLYKLAVKNMYYNNEYLFIDAWNEWGEGCYLEPDETNGYGYLEAVGRVMEKIEAPDFDINHEWSEMALTEGCFTGDADLQKNLSMYRLYYKILDRWMKLNECGKNVAEYFRNYEISTILIYGYTSVADHLICALENSGVKILGYIDRREDFKTIKMPVYNPERGFPDCDAIVVTPVYDYSKIRDNLVQKTSAEIISIEEVIFGTELD